MLTRTLPTLALPRVSPPRVSTSLVTGTALALSTIPSLLPRLPLTQGILTALLVLLALAALALGRRVVALVQRSPGHDATSPARVQPVPVRAQWVSLALVVSGVAGSVGLAHGALAHRASELGMVGPGATYWLVAGVWALAVTGLGLGLIALARRVIRVAWHLARRGWRRTGAPAVAAVLVGAGVTTGAAAPLDLLATVDLLAPIRKTMDPDHVLLSESPVGASRSFARYAEEPNPEAGARLAADRMVADGGLGRGAILIALPTGSGWVNREAVTAFEAQLDGDVAVVSAQYGNLPSWWSFLLDQEPAMRSADALVGEVVARVGELPAAQRPDIYVHGESLGALAGQAAIESVDPDAICGVIWSGAPGGASSGHPRERTLRNADDPVSHLESGTALHQPDDWPTAWLPGLSYGTTVLDLPTSLSPRPGHGHVYGPEQDWTLPTC